jgi:hypothetical protein
MRVSRLIMLLYGCLVLSVACQRETTTTPATPPQQTATQAPTPAKPQDLSDAKVKELLPLQTAPLEKSLLGASVGKDGLVAAEQMKFTAGSPIYLSMWVKDSPSGLQTSTTWFDAKKKEIAHESKPMNGAKTATFAMTQNLKPGKYHVTCYWGGNEACQYDFEVLKAAGKAKAKK